MKKVILALSLAILISLGIYAQQSMQLTFTAIDSTYYTQLDSIKIMNRTKDCDTMLYWNDTVLVLGVNVGLPKKEINEEFKVRAYPNPVMEKAILNVQIPEPGKTEITITNIQGRLILAESFNLTASTHDFKFVPGGDAMYFISFIWQGQTPHLKLINASPERGHKSILSYVEGSGEKAEKKSSARSDAFEFTLGDQLLYVGYIDTFESGITDVPLESETYTFQFAYNIPCIGTPTVEYEGQVYNAVQVFSQCWLKENLNVGTMIPGDQEMEDNGIIEKYCYNNEEDSCNIYGGLYTWDESMQYTKQEGDKGICPEGWHLPTDEEWIILEGAVDSYYLIEDNTWFVECRGYDVGKVLKSQTNWAYSGNGTDNFGFTALPGGLRNMYDGGFSHINTFGFFVSSTLSVYQTTFYSRSFIYGDSMSCRSVGEFLFGRSVRCVKD